VSGFKKFLLRGNVIDLAVAVVIGAAFGAVVTSLVKDLLTPLIAAIIGKQDFSKLQFTVNHSTFTYGDFINAVVTFVIIAAVVYFLVVSPVVRLTTFMQRNKEATERECPACFNEISVKATRCMFCTAEVTPTAPAVS
jgi:large conductance mechanosensitive channel